VTFGLDLANRNSKKPKKLVKAILLCCYNTAPSRKSRA
jgi:hypothetical protein